MTNDLLVGLRQNDSVAIKEIYQLAFPACAKLVTNYRGTTDDARDVFQEALIILHRNVRKPDFTLSCKVQTYLYSIVRNLWMRRQEQHRKKGLELVIDEPETEFIIIQEDELEEKRAVEEQHNIIAQCMGELSADCQKVLMGFYYKKQSLTEIAELLGYTANFVKVKKGRCMKSLREKSAQLFNKTRS
ncbi:MAG: RNA polymerase sigma factor [Saprospiraceae bacterium]